MGPARRRAADRRRWPLAGGTTLALVRKLPGVPGRRSRSGWPGSATSTPAGCSPTPAGGRGGRCSLAGAARVQAGARRRRRWPPCRRCVGGGIPRLVDDLAYGAGVWKGVLAEREPGPLRPRFTSWPRSAPAERRDRRSPTPASRSSRYRRGVTLRLTVDTEAWRRPRRAHVARSLPGLVPVVKGNGYGFGRGDAGARSPPSSPTRSPSARCTSSTTSRPGHAGRADADAATPPDRPAADPHRRLARPRRTPSPGGPAGCSSSWRRRCAASARRPTSSAPVTAAARPAGLDVVGFSVHPPVAGTRRRAPRRHRRAGSTLLDPDDEVWVSHLSPDGLPRPARRLARAPLPDPRSAPRCGTATRRALHLGADVARRAARRAPASTPATARASVPTRRHARHGRRRHRPRRAAARPTVAARSTSPGAGWRCSSRRTCTRRWSFVPAGEPAPRPGDRVDVQRPLISTLVDEVRWR